MSAASGWTHPRDGKTFEVTNPSTGEVLAVLPNMGVAEARRAIAAAETAQIEWAKKTGKARAAVLRKLYDLMMAHQDDLAAIMTAEQGKPLAEAKGEIAYGAAYVEWFGEEAKRVYGDTIPGHQEDKRIIVLKQPVGVVATITPWNFPNAMLARKVAPALAAGCAVVSKPARRDAAVGDRAGEARREGRAAGGAVQRAAVDAALGDRRRVLLQRDGAGS